MQVIEMSVSGKTKLKICRGRDCYLSNQEVVVFETLLLHVGGVWRSVELWSKGLKFKATD